MSRGSVVATLVFMVALQLVGGVLFASGCYETCPDDGANGSCPPICSFCTTCTHSQQAVVNAGGVRVPLIAEERITMLRAVPPPTQVCFDILHVPLFG